jgi:hypothetical protein
MGPEETMMRNLVSVFVVVCALVMAIPDTEAQSTTLTTTFAGGNGHVGNYFEVNVTAVNGITVLSMEGNFTAAGTVEVWARTGAIGGTPGTTGWTQVATATITAGQQSFTTNYSLAAGSHSFLFSNSGSLIYSNGSTLGAVYAQDSNLTIYEGHGTADQTPTSGNGYAFTPRVWNGSFTYTVAAITGPGAPGNISGTVLTQHDASGMPAVGAGLLTSADDSVTFRGVVTDADSVVAIQVEVKPIGTVFNGTTNLATGNFVASGSASEVTVTGLASGNYHWQARGTDGTLFSASFTSFGGNAELATDFTVSSISSGPGTGKVKEDGKTNPLCPMALIGSGTTPLPLVLLGFLLIVGAWRRVRS